MFIIFCYIFFFFWSIFTLFGFFIYDNLTSLNKNYLKKVGIYILIYPQQNFNSIEDIQNIFKSFNYITNIEIHSPKKLYQELEKNLPKGFINEEKIEEIFPYLVRVNLKSIDTLTKFNKDLEMIQKLTKNVLEVLPEPGIENLKFFKYANYGITIFLILWTFFYLLFFFFLNQGLNNHLKTQIEIFQLLGGHVFKLKLIRLLIIFIPLLIVLIISYLFYYFISQNLIYLFPFLKFFPNHTNYYDTLFFIIYFIYLIFIYPSFIVFLSYKKL